MSNSYESKTAIAAMRVMIERKDLTDLLPDTSLPALLINGKDDSLKNNTAAEQLNRQIKSF